MCTHRVPGRNDEIIGLWGESDPGNRICNRIFEVYTSAAHSGIQTVLIAKTKTCFDVKMPKECKKEIEESQRNLP